MNLRIAAAAYAGGIAALYTLMAGKADIRGLIAWPLLVPAAVAAVAIDEGRHIWCAVVGHDFPDDGAISKQCHRCGEWWQYYEPGGKL